MTTGEKVLVGVGLGVVVFVVWQLRSGGSIIAGGAPAGAASGTGSAATALANAGGNVANVVGTAVGTAYFGPAGKIIGAQAATDTRFNITTTVNTARAVGTDLQHGNIGGAVVDSTRGVLATAKNGLSAPIGFVKSLF